MENNIEHFADNSFAETGVNDTDMQVPLLEPAKKSTYPHGSARAMMAHMVKRKKKHQEAFTEELKNNLDLQTKFEELARRNNP